MIKGLLKLIIRIISVLITISIIGFIIYLGWKMILGIIVGMVLMAIVILSDNPFLIFIIRFLKKDNAGKIVKEELQDI